MLWRISMSTRSKSNIALRFFTVLLILVCGQNINAQIDTLQSYSEFLAYQGLSDTIYLDHERYHGLFAKNDCNQTDYGTTFSLPQGCWKRTSGNYSPRFWELGGKPSYERPNKVFSEVDAINSAAFAAWAAGGDTVEIDGIYEVDLPVWLLENNTYLGMSDSSGFKRIKPPLTYLRSDISVGDKKIIVESNRGFRNYHQINIAHDQAYDSLAGWVSYTASLAPQIGGDTTIFLSGRSIQKDMRAGDTVSLFFPIMKGVSWATAENISLNNLVFDGNRNQYDLNFDWRVNSTILFPTNNTSVIDHCRFYNIPSENIFLCGTKVINSSGHGFNGSALHFSCNTVGPETEVIYNDFRNVNEVGDSIMEHSEGAFTFSSRVRNVRMSYNHLSDLGEWGIGMFSQDDLNNTITDNIISSESSVGFRVFYPHYETNKIYNNKNTTFDDLPRESCFLKAPETTAFQPCEAFSSQSSPLKVGDVIEITLDSIEFINSNNNFVKAILLKNLSPYFELIDISIKTDELVDNHAWSNVEYDGKQGLIFDNGHKNGLYGMGNWGYEGCGFSGGCTELSLTFKVIKLPVVTTAVPCPLNSLEVQYDGDMGTWPLSVSCLDKTFLFEQQELGSPTLKGLLEEDELRVFPNPAQSMTTILSYESIQSVMLFDQMGKSRGQFFCKETNCYSMELSLAQLESGIYTISIKTIKGYVFKRLIIGS